MDQQSAKARGLSRVRVGEKGKKKKETKKTRQVGTGSIHSNNEACELIREGRVCSQLFLVVSS